MWPGSFKSRVESLLYLGYMKYQGVYAKREGEGDFGTRPNLCYIMMLLVSFIIASILGTRPLSARPASTNAHLKFRLTSGACLWLSLSLALSGSFGMENKHLHCPRQFKNDTKITEGLLVLRKNMSLGLETGGWASRAVSMNPG